MTSAPSVRAGRSGVAGVGMMLLALSVMSASPAAAQRAPTDPIRAQVDALTRRMPAGLRLLREPWTGALAQGATADAWVDLAAGRTYDLIPVCDADCPDFALRLYDAAGAEVAHASDLDDLLILHYTPARTGRYRLGFEMLTCTAAPCRWGVAMYGRG